ncbi:HAMP domain-containing sensor histidine kinase [Chitinivorax sp. PXF-14]|uniref:ATP-binding protein n=1 Tax=Chitinivorax sp. PXF-14 TaxID=3230488 RepID=UPI0034650222
MPTRLRRLNRPLADTPPSIASVLMLAPLHLLLVGALDREWTLPLLLIHFGLFLLWQPVLNRRAVLRGWQTPAILAVVGVAAYLATWWTLSIWLAILLALTAGQSLSGQRTPPVNLGVGVYLLTMALTVALPSAVGVALPARLHTLAQWGLPLLVILAALRSHRLAVGPADRPLDFVYSLLVFLLVSLIGLGAVVWHQQTGAPFFIALAEAMLLAALALYGLSRLWSPARANWGIADVFSIHLLGLGTPFEEWLARVGELQRQARDPDEFLSKALEQLATQPWVQGLQWQAGQRQGGLGVMTAHHLRSEAPPLQLTLSVNRRPGPALQLHVKLITQVLAEHYLAKEREEVMRVNTYNQAIFETGARLTHDVKNLLQTLKTLCSAAEHTSDDEAPALQALVKRQLPAITERLEGTLDRLRHPTAQGSELKAAKDWWLRAQDRWQGHGISFAASTLRGHDTLPAELFDSVLDNLLRNALAKRDQQPVVEIRVAMRWEGGISLSVEDSGHAIPDEVTTRLFRHPVASQRGGMGVGLHHVAQLAEQSGYRLRLDQNEPGGVLFRLAPHHS